MSKERLYFEKEETHTVKTKGYIEIDYDFFQVFKSILSCVADVKNGNSLKLLLYLMSENSDRTGKFQTSQDVYNSYNNWLKNKGSEGISVVTFREYIKDLFLAGIILKVSKGSYRFNPLHIWGDSINSRKDLVIELKRNKELI